MASASSTFKFSSLLAAFICRRQNGNRWRPFCRCFNSRPALQIHLTLILGRRSFFSLLMDLSEGSSHFHHNIADARNHALAISAFGSAGAGTVSLPTTLFSTSIDDNILAKPFKIDVATIQALKAGPAPKP
ncbi:hypothetical protein OIU78_001379 [Salix suchowensis]|nr:hypothetical protein OIU78_001379 [Salix suchowensis]